MEDRVVVGHHGLAGRHGEVQHQVGLVGGGVQQVEGFVVDIVQLDRRVLVSGDLHVFGHVPATHQPVAHAEHRHAVRGNGLVVRALFAEAVIAVTPGQPIQQVGPGASDLVEHGQRAHEPAHPAVQCRADAEEGQEVARVAVGGQFGAVSVGPGMWIHVGHVYDMTQAFAHDALGDGPPEAQPDAPEHQAQLVHRSTLHRESP